MNKNNKSEKLKKFVYSAWVKWFLRIIYWLLVIVWLVGHKNVYVDNVCCVMIIIFFLLHVVWNGLIDFYKSEDEINEES